MSKGSVNKVIVIGNLGADPEVRYMPSGSAVTNIRVATSERWKDRQTGEQQERVEWHRIVMFNKLGEIAGEYLRKGAKVYIEGKLQTRKWQDQSGNDRYSTDIIANEMQMLDNRGGSGSSGGYQAQQGQSAPASQGAAPSNPDNSGQDFDDDIPF